MNNAEKERLYYIIDKEDELSDEDKRELYFAEIANTEQQEEWEAQF